MNTRRDTAAAKRPKPDDTSSGSSEMSISQLADYIETKLESTKEELTKRFHEVVESVKAELKNELHLIRTQLEQTIKDLQLSVKRNEELIQLTADVVARSQNMNDVVVSGIPFLPHENLAVYFEKWCTSLGFASTPLADIRRLSKSQMIAGRKYMILVQFAMRNQRNEFYAKYMQTRSLTLDQLGFKTKDRIYVNENLTVTDRAIKSNALAAKKENKLHSVFSRDGVVHVKRMADSVAEAIKTMDYLNRFVTQR